MIKIRHRERYDKIQLLSKEIESLRTSKKCKHKTFEIGCDDCYYTEQMIITLPNYGLQSFDDDYTFDIHLQLVQENYIKKTGD